MSAIHSNISIFVPHIGCPNMCSFCNQRHITGKRRAPRSTDVKKTIETAINSKNFDPKTTEIAFFGGSFTAINRQYMLGLLETAYEYVKNGSVCGIRISTRPDAIDEEILELLKSYGVTAIELGAQSLDDKVLKLNNRGHTARDVVNASNLIKKFGFSLGLQMMTGLYADTDQKAIKTAEKIIELRPDTVRIYPTVVLKDTDLEAFYAEKFYKPQTLDQAISLATKLLLMFNKTDIKVIRLGLHSIEPKAYIAGPWHPAFAELCQSEIFLNKAISLLKETGNYVIKVNPSDVSKMVGQKKSNIIKLQNNGYKCKVIADKNLSKNEIVVERG